MHSSFAFLILFALETYSITALETTPSPALNFMVIGDWGYTNNSQQEGQKRVAQAMKNKAQTLPIDFVMAVGDNFYLGGDYNYEGVISSMDDKWSKMWAQVYDKSLAQVPWYAILGNHDWYSMPEAQIQHSKIQPRWVFPNFFWSRSLQVGNATIALIFIDTNLIHNGYDGDRTAMKENFKRLGWTADSKILERQVEWVAKTLQKASSADYIFVAGHHPLGTCPEQEIGSMPQIKELLLKHRVSAYFFGHHHALQSTSIENTLFVQSGAGGKHEEMCHDAVGWGVSNQFGFAMTRVSENGFQVEFVDDQGQVLKRVQGVRRY